MNTLQDYFRTYGVSGEGAISADQGYHTAQRPPTQPPPPVIPTPPPPPPEEEEDSFAEMLGHLAPGGGAVETPYKDMSEFANVGGIINTLNGMGHRGQEPYQNFTQGFNNPYIQQLLGRG